MGYGSTLREINWALRTAGSVLSRIIVPRISRVGIITTHECNQRCRTCNIWSINKKNPELRDREMTIGEFREFCSNNPGILWSYLSGGEPTLKKDFKEFLAVALGMDSMRLINMSTNGQEPDILVEALSYALGKVDRYLKLVVDVSLEGVGKTHDLIAGKPGSFGLALKTYEAVRELSFSDSRVLPKFEYTISSYNAGELSNLVDFLRDRYGLRFKDLILTIGMDASFFNLENSGKFLMEKDALESELEYAFSQFSLWDRLNLFSGVNYKFLKSAIKDGKPKYVGLKYSVLIDPYWNVYPTTFHYPAFPVGNLRELDFRLSNLDTRNYNDDGCKLQWTACDAYPVLVFRPWRLL